MVEFPRELTVDVTEADVRNGQPRRCNTCPIALAVMRGYPYYFVEVNSNSILLREPRTGRSLWYTLPAEAKDFIDRFDSRDSRDNALAEPFAFKAAAVPEYADTIPF